MRKTKKQGRKRKGEGCQGEGRGMKGRESKVHNTVWHILKALLHCIHPSWGGSPRRAEQPQLHSLGRGDGGSAEKHPHVSEIGYVIIK